MYPVLVFLDIGVDSGVISASLFTRRLVLPDQRRARMQRA